MIRVPSPSSALLFVAGVAVLFVPGSLVLSRWLGEAGMVAAEWLLLLPVVVFLRVGGHDPAATLLLRPVPFRALSAGALLALGAMPLAWGIGWAQGFVLPVPPEMEEALRELVTARTPTRLAWLLAAVALTPALCEEAVFRGVLLSSTRTLATWRAVVLNGLVFGAFHLSFEAPVRFLPTAWVGIVIAWAVLQTGSVWIGVLMHFLHNASIVLLASATSLGRLVTEANAPPPAGLVVAGIVFLLTGARVVRGKRRSPFPENSPPSRARP